jgi:hypothetical protein
MYDKQKIEEMVSTVRNALVDERVSQITDHFAGYFDELGITVAMKDSTLDEEIRELKNKLLPVVAELQMPFLWMVTFQRAGKSAATLFPDGLFTGAKASPRVAIVLEPESEQLDQMATTMPVWAVESPNSRSVAARFWERFRNAYPTDIGLTLFKVDDLNARYENLIGVLDAVEEHHWGVHQLYVFGLKLTEQCRADLQVLGFSAFSKTENGFVVTKQVSS